MLRRASLVVATVAAGLACALPMASADDTGLATMHSWRKVGKKTCFVDHYHDGAGSGATRDAAEKAAISSWAGFTALEYGSDWGSWSLAANKSMKCDNFSTEHKCNVSAIPCRGR